MLPLMVRDSLAALTDEDPNALGVLSPQSGFDPEGDGYDYATANYFGMKPDNAGHWSSRAPNGQLLKGRKHLTWPLTLMGEDQSGYVIRKGRDGRYYSFPRLWDEE